MFHRISVLTSCHTVWYTTTSGCATYNDVNLKTLTDIKQTDSIANNEGFVRVLPPLHMHKTGISDSCMHTFRMQNRRENVQTTMGQYPALN